MKKIYFFLIVCLVNFSLNAQIISIPDSNFKAFLLASSTSNSIAKNSFGNNFKIDSNNNNEIEVSEALNVIQLNIATNVLTTTNNISNLTGIVYFTNLKTLNCSGNQITTLDLTSLLNLEEIKASDNDLISVSISGLVNLKKINLNHNLLTSINVNNFVSLQELFIYDNNITALNFLNNPSLEMIDCKMNSIATLDLTGLNSLNLINCSSNLLTNLNITGLPNIDEVACENNNLTSLNVAGLNTLRILFLSNNQISSIDVSSLSSLEMFDCSNNTISVLNVNYLNDLVLLKISNTLISTIDCSLSSVTNLIAENCINLLTINLKNNIISISEPDLLFYAFRIGNNPQLVSICVDNGEQNNLSYNGFSYNTSGNVLVYVGATCSTIVQPLSTHQFLDQSRFVVFPNPVSNNIVIQNENSDEIYSIEIYNSLGQLIKTITKIDIAKSITVDVSSITAGTYFINLFSTKGKFTQKFIKV